MSRKKARVVSGGLFVQHLPHPEPPGAISLCWGWGMGTFHMAAAAPLECEWGAEAGMPGPFFKPAGLGPPASPRASVSAGFGSPGARLRSFPSPSPGNRIWRPPFSLLSFLAAFLA